MPDSHLVELAKRVATLADSRGVTVAVAESLTGGTIATHLAAAGDAADWFRGGIVAYAPQVKFDVLHVPEGPVINDVCASAMATGALELLDADVAVAATGVGGPDPVEGHEPGTVWLATATRSGSLTALVNFTGDPTEVVSKSVAAALQMLIRTLENPENEATDTAIAM